MVTNNGEEVGGATKREVRGVGGGAREERGQEKFYPNKNSDKVLAMLKGGWDSFSAEVKSFSNTKGGPTTCFHPFKGGKGNVLLS